MSNKPLDIIGKDCDNPIVIDGQDNENQSVSQSKTGSKHSTREKENECISYILIDDEPGENQSQLQVKNDCNYSTAISKELSIKVVNSEERIHDKKINSTDRSGLPSHLFDIASALVETDNKIKEKNVSRQIKIKKNANANDTISGLPDLYSEPSIFFLSKMEKDLSKDKNGKSNKFENESNFLMNDETSIRYLNRELNGLLNPIILD